MSAIDLEALKVQATRAHRMTCSDPDDPARETPYSVHLKLIAALEAALATADALIAENQDATTLQAWGLMTAAQKIRMAIKVALS